MKQFSNDVTIIPSTSDIFKFVLFQRHKLLGKGYHLLLEWEKYKQLCKDLIINLIGPCVIKMGN